MTPEQKLTVIVESARGDDLERAIAAFGKMSDAELDKEWGQSNQTCRDILAAYRNERSLYEKARQLLMTKLGR